jgi:chitin synthase
MHIHLVTKFSFLLPESNLIGVLGSVFEVNDTSLLNTLRTDAVSKGDASHLFEHNPDQCQALQGDYKFKGFNNCGDKCLKVEVDLLGRDNVKSIDKLLFSFDGQDKPPQDSLVINGTVLNFFYYFQRNPREANGDIVHNSIVNLINSKKGQDDIPDGTLMFSTSKELMATIPCLEDTFKIGAISKDSPTCFLYDGINYFFLIVVLTMLFSKVLMALFFSWFISPKLARDPNPKKGALLVPANYPPPVCHHPNGPNSQPPATSPSKSMGAMDITERRPPSSSERNPYVMMLVTAYSEGIEALQLTLDSMASTIYPNDRKCFFIIADGIVKGGGNDKPTPDIILDMMEIDPLWGADPKPYSYRAVASGSMQHNMAKVYVGHYGKLNT